MNNQAFMSKTIEQFHGMVSKVRRELQNRWFYGTSDCDRRLRTIHNFDFADQVEKRIDFLYAQFSDYFEPKAMKWPLLYLSSGVKRKIKHCEQELDKLYQESTQVSLFPEDQTARDKRIACLKADLETLKEVKRMLSSGSRYFKPLYEETPST